MSEGILLSDSHFDLSHKENADRREFAKYYTNCAFRSSQPYHTGVLKLDPRQASLEPSFDTSQAASLRNDVLAELKACSLMGENVGKPRYYVPFVVAKIAAHQWLHLITRFGYMTARREVTDLPPDTIIFSAFVKRVCLMRDFLQIITSNMCDISAYLSKDFEPDRAACNCRREYPDEDSLKRLHSVMNDFAMVSNTAQRAIDRMDRHIAVCGSSLSVEESRKSIEVSKKVRYVGKPG